MEPDIETARAAEEVSHCGSSIMAKAASTQVEEDNGHSSSNRLGQPVQVGFLARVSAVVLAWYGIT